MAEISRVSGKEVRPYLAEIAKLRIEIFREYPYLYDGSEAYERDYLEVYAKSDRSVIVLAIEDSEIVGASTGLPLIDADEAFQKPFRDAGIDPAAVFYFGESVLKKSWRGRGIGHRFFDQREAHAAKHGFSINAFCAVQRPADHPLKPADHRDNDEFWRKRGYQKTPEMTASLSWQEIDQPQEVCNQLVFWLKRAI